MIQIFKIAFSLLELPLNQFKLNRFRKYSKLIDSEMIVYFDSLLTSHQAIQQYKVTAFSSIHAILKGLHILLRNHWIYTLQMQIYTTVYVQPFDV